MPSMVAGRFLQGVGGGGLVPATLALVADLYPVERRGVPLGVVSAVQEIGSVLGPLFGALVLAVADWRAIFAGQPGRRAGARRRDPRRSPVVEVRRPPTARAPGDRDPTGSASLLALVTLVAGVPGLRPAQPR